MEQQLLYTRHKLTESAHLVANTKKGLTSRELGAPFNEQECQENHGAGREGEQRLTPEPAPPFDSVVVCQVPSKLKHCNFEFLLGFRRLWRCEPPLPAVVRRELIMADAGL
jgi:hypothetical protein